jgi:hypothetical protein
MDNISYSHYRINTNYIETTTNHTETYQSICSGFVLACMAGSIHLTSLISPVFMFFATITGRSTGVDVRIVGCVSSSTLVLTTSNGLAVLTVDAVEGWVLDSFPSVENICRCTLYCCGLLITLDDVDDAVNA